MTDVESLQDLVTANVCDSGGKPFTLEDVALPPARFGVEVRVPCARAGTGKLQHTKLRCSRNTRTAPASHMVGCVWCACPPARAHVLQVDMTDLFKLPFPMRHGLFTSVESKYFRFAGFLWQARVMRQRATDRAHDNLSFSIISSIFKVRASRAWQSITTRVDTRCT
ncbi:hypothetical protein EON66_07160 [archaeon]|nr:MAG: hypothetical protein EON66_07160 [archaeon]